ncbi:hypothetical protein [Lysobacter capsici]|uniref:hypothetical protein n=1 Tax=Lysobacter capsici TaxID=435897 RepID=UPI001C007EE5|nr:hypothetical protein [Lysobacter capsici]QWF15179.1 hypothetical protein KME82_15375 [Lysobacter capsici]
MHRITEALLLSIAIAAPASATATTSASATARSVSSAIVSGTKYGANEDSKAGNAQIQCVQRIPNDALADAVQGVIGSALSPAELTYLETFYASALGTRFVKAMADNIDPIKPFTDAQWKQIKAVEDSPQQAKLRKVTAVENPKAAAAIGGALKSLLDKCFNKT